jgi:hypothetical protein
MLLIRRAHSGVLSDLGGGLNETAKLLSRNRWEINSAHDRVLTVLLAEERFCFCQPQTDWAQLARPCLPFALRPNERLARLNLKASTKAQRPIPLQDQLL